MTDHRPPTAREIADGTKCPLPDCDRHFRCAPPAPTCPLTPGSLAETYSGTRFGDAEIKSRPELSDRADVFLADHGAGAMTFHYETIPEPPQLREGDTLRVLNMAGEQIATATVGKTTHTDAGDLFEFEFSVPSAKPAPEPSFVPETVVCPTCRDRSAHVHGDDL